MGVGPAGEYEGETGRRMTVPGAFTANYFFLPVRAKG
jgi:hypothetical protein